MGVARCCGSGALLSLQHKEAVDCVSHIHVTGLVLNDQCTLLSSHYTVVHVSQGNHGDGPSQHILYAGAALLALVEIGVGSILRAAAFSQFAGRP